MSIFSFLRRRKEKNSETVGLDDERLLEWLGVDTGNPKAINEATYFTCLKMLSETMGKLPLHYYQRSKDGRIRAEPTDMTRLLCIRPNEYMTPTTLWTTTEFLCQEYGNAYIWIQSKFIRSGRYGGQVRYFGLYPMRPCDVTVWMDDAGIFGRAGAIHYQYTNPKTGQSVMLNASEVMHFKTWYSTDGVMGEPVKKILADTIDGGNQSQKYMNNLYKNGLTASMVMQYSSDIDEDRVKQLKRKFRCPLFFFSFFFFSSLPPLFFFFFPSSHHLLPLFPQFCSPQARRAAGGRLIKKAAATQAVAKSFRSRKDCSFSRFRQS